MIISLTSSVSFPSTGKALSNTLELEPGLTAIIGRNGRGKTFTGNEMPRYLLFGAKALRAERAQYVALAGRMVFEVRGSRYTVDRSPKAESLIDSGGVVLAVGADAVNKKIVELFGYGLDVFDVANACRQGKVQQLTDMLPAQRKEMIDRLVGLDKVEAIEKDCKDKAKALRGEAEAMRSLRGVVPTVPGVPEKYVVAKEREAAMAELLVLQADRQRILAIIAAVGDPPSSAPAAAVSPDLWKELANHHLDRLGLLSKLQALDNEIQYIPDARMTREQIDQAKVWAAYEAELRQRGAKPELPIDDIERSEAEWLAFDSWKPMVPCEKCGHGAHHPKQPFKPLDTKAYLQAQRLANDRWLSPLEVVERPAVLGDVAAAEHALAQQPQLLALQAERDAIVLPTDRSQELKAMETLNREWQVYLQLKEDYDRRAKAAAGLVLPEDVADHLADLRQCETASRAYELAVAAYAHAEAGYVKITDAAAERDEAAEGFAAGAKALKELRLEFKTHLAPAVGLVASQLITAMSGGELQNVEVSPEFEVTVDGQPIRTMSGSEAAVANLALRIGLGQVLTNKVFPVFLGDEIDADMDDERVEHTARAIRGLSTVLKQIVLVTHKEINADQTIII